MPLELKSSLGFAAPMSEVAALEPAITRWQRLESDIAALDMAPSLQARIADPLWLVGRQWQFGELLGEDAGTPLTASIEGEKLPLRFAAGTPRGAEPLANAAGLIEPVVEAEPARDDNAALAAQAGLDFERALLLHGVASMVGAFRTRFPFQLTPEVIGALDADAREFTVFALARGIDGRALAAALAAHVADDGNVTALPEGIEAGAAAAAVLRAAREWLAEWRSLVFEPAGESLWRDSRLEYSFALESAHAAGTTALPAEEYHGGRLDWYTFDRGSTAAAAAPGVAFAQQRLPVPIRYPGMPADRYWECEDGAVNLAGATGGPTTISLLLLLEYAFAASNDWFHLPLELDYGTAFKLDRLTVKDTFGVAVEIGRAQDAVFELTPTSDGAASPAVFILPQVTAHTLEADPMEEVAMFRDEMANLVWGVERQRAGFFGCGIDCRAAASNASVLSQQPQALDGVDAAVVYRLQSTVALNWFPFVARQDPAGPPGRVLLTRRNLRRLVESAGGIEEWHLEPRGRLLQGSAQPFEVEEPEVPRSGLILKRRFQHARTADGRRVVWLGREKQVGGGEGRSELRHDYLEPAPRP